MKLPFLFGSNSGGGGGGAVDSVAGKTGVVTLTKGDVGLSNVDNTADSAKPVSTAQASADAAVRAAAIQRTNHTGTQSADTITDGTTNKAYTATEKTKLAGIASGATANTGDVTLSGAQTLTGQKKFDLRPNLTVTDRGTNLTTTALPVNTSNRGTLSSAKTLTFTGTPAEGDSILLKLLVTAAATLTFPSCKRIGASNTAITSLPLSTGNYLFLWQYIAGEWVLTDSVGGGRVHFTWSFNPKAVCDGTIDRLFLMSIGEDFPNGFVATSWKFSFDADPPTEADIDLKRADAFIGVANAAVMDQLDTTAGVSSESTAANINSGAAIANGKVMYLEFGTAYTVDNLQCIFELWGYAVN